MSVCRDAVLYKDDGRMAFDERNAMQRDVGSKGYRLWSSKRKRKGLWSKSMMNADRLTTLAQRKITGEGGELKI